MAKATAPPPAGTGEQAEVAVGKPTLAQLTVAPHTFGELRVLVKLGDHFEKLAGHLGADDESELADFVCIPEADLIKGFGDLRDNNTIPNAMANW